MRMSTWYPPGGGEGEGGGGGGGGGGGRGGCEYNAWLLIVRHTVYVNS